MPAYSSLCPNFVTTAPVLFLPDFLLNTLHQYKKKKKEEKEIAFSNGIICFSPHTDINRDELYEENGQKRDILRTKNNERKKSTNMSLRHVLNLETDSDRAFLNFPFLIDSKTCTHLRKPDTKVMFIMRGLPGSGKSTIVQKIKSLYAQVVVCSADDYFYNEDGVYRHNTNLLGAAHTHCQNKATQACQQNVPIVVIDNTNVKRWEMKFYADLGNTHGYVVVTLQPKTDWKMNPAELALRNKHGVTVDILRKKVQMFEDVIPSYYGWFVNEKKSECLMTLASKIVLECIVKFPDLKNYLLNELSIKPEHISDEMAEQILSNYHTIPGKKSPLLHCTSRFCGSGKAPGSLVYHKRGDVQNACGQVFELAVTGLIITKRTVGVRVTLSPSAAPLFKNVAEEEWIERSPQLPLKSRKNAKLSKLKSKKFVKLPKNMKNAQKMMLTENLNTDVSQQLQNTFLSLLNQKFPLLTVSGPMRSAHFTLKTYPGVESKEVNTDILDICHIESSEVFNLPELVQVSGGQACYFGEGVCCIYFDKATKIRTVFSGYY